MTASVEERMAYQEGLIQVAIGDIENNLTALRQGSRQPELGEQIAHSATVLVRRLAHLCTLANVAQGSSERQPGST